MATVTITLTDGPANGPFAADLICELGGDAPVEGAVPTKAQYAAMGMVAGLASTAREVKTVVVEEDEDVH